jgi:hypothetical protein
MSGGCRQPPGDPRDETELAELAHGAGRLHR